MKGSFRTITGQPSLLQPLHQRQAIVPETFPGVHAIGVKDGSSGDIPKNRGTPGKVFPSEISEGFLHKLRMRQEKHQVIRAEQLDDCIMPQPPIRARFETEKEWQGENKALPALFNPPSGGLCRSTPQQIKRHAHDRAAQVVV